MAKPKIVILCMENRSFDEYFGTFPGAVGFNDPNGAEIFSQPGFTDNSGTPIPNLKPFRMSSFSTSSEWSPGYGHQWAPQQLSWNLGAMNGWSTHAVGNTTMPDGSSVPNGASALGFFASNDIPYLWSLAKSFLLCDTYFCSVLSGTGPNRCMLMSGTLTNPSDPLPSDSAVIAWNSTLNLPYLSNYFAPPTFPGGAPNTTPNYPWWSYAGLLGNSRSWKIYDDQQWQPSWISWPPPVNGQPTLPPSYFGGQWPGSFYFNLLDSLQDANPNNFSGNVPNSVTGATGPIGTSTDKTSGFYSLTESNQALSNFETDINSPTFPDVSWILPPSYLTAHPDFLPADAECYLARVVNAVINSTYWKNENIVLIITHDENDGHFDHVTPPTSLDNQKLKPNPTPITGSTEQTTQQPQYPQSGSWEPWVSTPGPGSGNQISGGDSAVTGPMGAGFRVPTIIVSPWTYGAGLSSACVPGAQFDHTSILQYLEEVTNVPCTNLPSTAPKNWRRETFSSLGKLIDMSRPAVAAEDISLPSVSQVDQWRTDALTRLFGNNPETVILPAPSPSAVQAWPPLQQQCYLIMEKTTFGRDEVEAQLSLQNNVGPATFADAFYVVVDGFEPAELNLASQIPLPSAYAPILPITALTLSGTQNVAPGISIAVGPAVPDNSGLAPVPQRFRFACSILFNDIDLAFAGITTTTPALLININAMFTSRLSFNAPIEQIELVDTADPYVQNGPTLVESNDLRVFQVKADGVSSLFGATHITLDPSNPDPLQFIRNLLAWLNDNPNAWPPPPDPDEESTEDAVNTVTVFPTDGKYSVFDFALTRVSMQGLSDTAQNVRVFFRLFPAQSTGTAYDPTTMYRCTPATTSGATNPSGAQIDTQPSTTNPGWQTRVPLLGIGATQATGSDIVSIPFFAVPRVDASQINMAQQKPDSPNAQEIIPNTGGATVYKFFGCWLDINLDPSQGPTVQEYAKTAQYPAVAPTSSGHQDGPYSFPLQPIKAFVMSQHQCIVAEVVYDQLPPIATGTIPGDSDKLVQRNLTVQGGVNA